MAYWCILRRASDFVAFHDYQPFIEAGHQWRSNLAKRNLAITAGGSLPVMNWKTPLVVQ